MIRTRSRRSTLAILDGAIAFCCGLALSGVDQGFLLSWDHRRFTTADVLCLLFFVAAWHYTFAVLYSERLYRSTREQIAVIVKGAFALATLLTLFLYAVYATRIGWGIFLQLWMVFAAYELTRVLLSRALARHRAMRNPQRVVILGSGRRAGIAWKELRLHYSNEIVMLGFVDRRPTDILAPDIADRLIAQPDQLAQVLVEQVVDVLIVAMPLQSCYADVQDAITVAESAGVEVVYLNDVFVSSRAIFRPDNIFAELALRKSLYIHALFTKRVLDVVGSVIGLVVLLPVFVAVFVAVKLSSPGPAMFVQQRHGLRRRLFPLIKFRSMIVDAEALMPQLEAMNEADGPIFKLAADPRVTPVGAFLRRTSLDELPQLLNVLAGQMSLVGPRPMSTRDVSLMSDAVSMRRFSVKPGMTGLWQVSGRSSVGFDDWIVLDGTYIDRWSLGLDLHILIRTVKAVVSRAGAV